MYKLHTVGWLVLILFSATLGASETVLIPVSGRIVPPSSLSPKNVLGGALTADLSAEDSCNGGVVAPYAPMDAKDIHYEGTFTVLASSLDPEAAGGLIPLNVGRDGTFKGSVPPSGLGYCFSAAADRILLLDCRARAIGPGDALKVELTVGSTIRALALSALDRNFLPLEAPLKLVSLSTVIERMILAVREPLTASDWNLAGRQAAGLTDITLPVPPADAWGAPRRFTDEDRAPYALSAPSEIPDSRTLSFAAKSEDVLAGQPYWMQGVRFSGSFGSRARVLQSPEGHLVVSHLLPGETLQITFAGPVRSLGFRMANGRSPGSSSLRRAFRLRAYDRMGAPLAFPLNWYTNQSGSPSFYGLAVNSDNPSLPGDECRKPDGRPAHCERPIHRLTLSVSKSVAETPAEQTSLDAQGDPFYIDDISFSPTYPPMYRLGWVADGWERADSAPGPAPSGKFVHTDRDTGTSPDPDSECTYVNNWSGGGHWVARYPDTSPGGWVRKTLTGPAFTLTNLPLDPEDMQNADKWGKGPLSTPLGPLFTRLVRNSGGEACLDSFDGKMDPNVPGGWNQPNAPVEWTWALTRCRVGDPLACPVSQWLWAPQGTWSGHWSHVHAQIHYAVERSSDGREDAVLGEAPHTRIYQEYSTDNGGSWKKVFWHHDEDHRGRNGIWYHSHNHPFADSDLAAYETQYQTPGLAPATRPPARLCRNTDFHKNGWKRFLPENRRWIYNYDFLTRTADGRYLPRPDGRGAADTGDSDWDGECREWDTEFYQDVDTPRTTQDLDGCCRVHSALSPGDKGSCLITNGQGCFIKKSGARCGCEDDPIILGTTLRYRFVFETNAAGSQLKCHGLDGSSMPCEGVRLDDVAFNNDTIDGYYTDFEYFENQNLGSRP